MTIKSNLPYIPSFLKASLTDTRPVQLTFSDLIDTNIASTSSFKYEPLNYPLKNTQQLNVDWTKFENHTFFSSAEVKVNVAFDQIINGYPFDGTKTEVERFFEKIGGFEKWVFEQLPKFGGELHFSGTLVGEDTDGTLGTWISVKDTAGWLYPTLSKNQTGESILNPPIDKSLTIEMQLYIPSQSNGRQVVFQKMSSDKAQGFTLHLEPSTTPTVFGTFSIVSGGVNNSVTAELERGVFNHICVSLNRENQENSLQFFVNEELAAVSADKKEIGAFNDTSNLLIGSGSSFYVTGTLITPTQTLSGTLDELRLFHSYRTLKQQQIYSTKGLYATEALKLYYRFNEPPVPFSSNPADDVNSIVLDSSGNALHALISNFTSSLRLATSSDPLSPMTNEKSDFKTILFPYHPDVISLNETLLTSASLYDQANPNLITKLIPRHYLREGAVEEGYENTTVEGTIIDAYSGQGIPGNGQIGSAQVMLTFLYIWSKFFDEIKMYVDAFKTLRTVDYSLTETVPDNFLNDFITSYGFYLPPLFNSSKIDQYVDGEDISEIGISDYTIKQVQSLLLRRVLVNMPDILKSKGTQHSIRSFLRSIGIDPDNSLRIREFGGPSLRQLGTTRELKTELTSIVNFQTSSLVTTPFLSASRVEPGFPSPSGSFVKNANGQVIGTNVASDGLLTSGSWTVEGIFKFAAENVDKASQRPQSLFRLEVTGSAATAKPGIIANVVSSGSLYAFIRPGMNANAPLLQLQLDADILNGDRWNVCLGCVRNDATGSNVSSSYFFRAATQNAGEITSYYVTSSFFQEDPTATGNALRVLSSTNNASGSRIAIGYNPNIPAGGMGYLYLNSTLDASSTARTTEFAGRASNVRFWSKDLSEEEWREHVRNYKSLGVIDPLVNYNYVTNRTGSFEKLRLSILEKQTEKSASLSGAITFIDFSENGFHASGSGWPTTGSVLVGDLADRSYLSPYFDEYSTSEKIRVRGFSDEEYLKDAPWATLGQAYELPANETPLDDPRLSIEFSLIDSLNKDIINMFATLDAMATAIGSPELAFSPDYPDLEKLRNVYFNRISEKLNFRSFFEFYRWFDTSISSFIEQLVPRKTKFKGTNFVVESHMLERHKIEYQSSEIYLGDATRGRIRDTLLVQQISGDVSRY